MKKVMLFGTFDRLHPGHRFLLREALRRGAASVVVARDANVRKLKGRVPEQSEEERRRAVESAFPEVRALLGDPEDFLAPVRAIRPELILLGYDQTLPPGVREEDLPCPVERLPAFEPGTFKSSFRRSRRGK